MANLQKSTLRPELNHMYRIVPELFDRICKFGAGSLLICFVLPTPSRTFQCLQHVREFQIDLSEKLTSQTYYIFISVTTI